ncbi:aminotransferase class V-fold PLP-dependent enzyme, partial [Desulfobacterales bacterium HSG17]|nr:aminotransferase class V-fold PLP-dependent enzyme [Desulfobacterales bacterium HSG17]
NLFAALLQDAADNVAIIPAVSYGIALAAKNVKLERGQSIVVLEDQFPSNIYSWHGAAKEKGAFIIVVKRPEHSNWTSAVLDAISENTAVAALPNCHWTDGTFIDLLKVGEKCRSVGAALVVDGTQSLGAMPFSISQIQPDFLITTAHKWLLGPYSLGFCYAAPKYHNGIPLEENWLNRAGSEDFSRLVDYRDEYQAGARRFDMGEASNFILAPVAAAGLEQLLEWKVENIAATLKAKTDYLAEKAAEIGMKTAQADARSPHMLGILLPDGMAKVLSARLAAEKIYVSVRGDSIRIAPNVYNDDDDLERFLKVLKNSSGL